MSLLRRALAVCVAAGLAAAGLALGGAFRSAEADPRAQGQRSRRPDADHYGDRAPSKIGDEITVGGRPLDVSVFNTADPAGEVIAFYQKAWSEEGLRVAVLMSEDGNQGTVTTIDKQGWQRSVSAVTQNGTTLVLPAVTDGRKPPRIGGRAEAARLPVLKDHQSFLDFTSRDGDKKSYSMQYTTALSPDDAAAFYGAEMAKEGLGAGSSLPAAALGAASKAGARILEFNGAQGRSSTVTIQALGEGKGCQVFAVLEEGAGPAP